MCYILFMKKKIWTIFLLIANCITIFFLFTLGLLFWIIELNFNYEPGFTRLELIKYVLFIIISAAIYIAIATAGIISIIAHINILTSQPLTRFNKISIWITRIVMVLLWGGILAYHFILELLF